MKKLIFCFDIYNILCISPNNNYKKSKPIKTNIKLVNYLIKQYKGLDILINCVGICINPDAEKVKNEEWRKVIDINLNSMFYICKEIGRLIIKQKYGNIVNIGSN